MSNLVKTTSYGTEKTILIAPELAFTIPVQVTNTGITADADGKKIIKAGTPIGGSTNVLENRNTVLVVANGSTAQGVILHDVDVTAGQENATMVVAGYVDLNKIAVANQPVADAKAALTKITFMKGI
jgi:hypothetical protein